MIIQNDRPAHASIERTAAWYCLGQSVLTLVWWGWLVVFPELTSYGAGTPFPYDKTRELVVSGAYGWIRNPMAVTGLLQGICVGLMLGSPLVLVYVICGAAIWQFLVRPVEEQMMEEQFGASYVAYKAEVNCWLPRLFR